MHCELLEECPFMKKWQGLRNALCSGFIQLYCKDGHGEGCKRKEYGDINGIVPSPNMMPNGQMMADC